MVRSFQPTESKPMICEECRLQLGNGRWVVATAVAGGVRVNDYLSGWLSRPRWSSSGAWFLEKRTFIEWMQSDSPSILWLHGIPGYGKTHLVSLVIDHFFKVESCTSPRGVSAFFYYARSLSESERSSLEEILRCFLQKLWLTAVDGPIREPIATMYETKKREADHTPCDPVSLSVEECVAQIISILDQTPGIKVIDALDECDPSQRHTIRGALDDVVRQSSKPIMIFASSRDDQDIVRRMGHAREVFISAVDNDNDIGDSVATEVEAPWKMAEF
ncbi:uncharacterized protein IWZ02DRAFT_85255 [Phyllosticta citriasiana]|uniref:uncharacterized protein n=1 Tax=Phyllosticta citriasiana TaxID=595635 RepID=UPI0030FDE0F4